MEKSISELHKKLTKETEIRQEQQSEVVTLIAKNAAATELIKLAVNRLNGFFASKLQSEASTEANHEYCSDDELAKACEKKADSETRRATHSSELEAVISTSSAADKESAGVRRRLRMNAMCADAREIFAIAGVQEALWPQSQDLDLDDTLIAESTQIGYPLHADPDVLVIMQRQLQQSKSYREQLSCLRLCSSTVLKTFQLRNIVCYPQRKLYRKQRIFHSCGVLTR